MLMKKMYIIFLVVLFTTSYMDLLLIRQAEETSVYILMFYGNAKYNFKIVSYSALRILIVWN